ncbi:hypothetical protein AtNW77_Chr1g0073991 [Arabidopsis thaliana]|uniref:Uncharacterized protein F28P22.23 n=4 Tax=Arabidopsis TaxID=3701 RepID=Q9CAH4_ARATH|nr:uncharacterized protein AT1G72580 [Arabidopsis thaliana]KAG7651472.1 hypothetical protein ISN45_At01g063330 [Arabidopsis thaliana x Arabidopsis arenosa]KAG7659330.1 hypothetical protein ISN44_As01g062210 [Arabidopsis suecica]AAG51857.1 hypothetical protein; 75815-76111 [Arabidopsis thaliana]AEE35344.1 hypothetical protein AT1G72580 [Arabidopsis thaliana]OAP17243.1 hypothetical protein AXX17_AT1G66760 [Arabidopsis thaliana]|eukprot:NP_177402.1 hypothetical protein AT1G72580 [Arabidopsis thaliana]
MASYESQRDVAELATLEQTKKNVEDVEEVLKKLEQTYLGKEKVTDDTLLSDEEMEKFNQMMNCVKLLNNCLTKIGQSLPLKEGERELVEVEVDFKNIP